MERMFENALRGKYRFPYKGQIGVEDLFDLSIENLDSIFKVLNSQLKQTKEESLLQVKTKQDEELSIKIEIIKYIVGIKIDEENARLRAKDIKEQKQKIMEILSTKKDESLHGKSIEELQIMLDSLG